METGLEWRMSQAQLCPTPSPSSVSFRQGEVGTCWAQTHFDHIPTTWRTLDLFVILEQIDSGLIKVNVNESALLPKNNQIPCVASPQYNLVIRRSPAADHHACSYYAHNGCSARGRASIAGQDDSLELPFGRLHPRHLVKYPIPSYGSRTTCEAVNTGQNREQGGCLKIELRHTSPSFPRAWTIF